MNEFGASILKSCAGSKERRKLLRVQGLGCKVSGFGIFHVSSERLHPQPRGLRGQLMHPGSGCKTDPPRGQPVSRLYRGTH